MAGRPIGTVAAALTLSGTIAAVGYRRRALSGSGTVGAMLVGTATYLAGGPRWSVLLLGFFGSSSALSRLEGRSADGRSIAAMAERGSRRDLVQALANGGVATLAALCRLRFSHPAWAAAYAGALAAANADTWATEIGGLSRTPPRHILTNAPVEPGTSGGVTAAGLGGAVAGSVLIGALSALALGGSLSAGERVARTGAVHGASTRTRMAGEGPVHDGLAGNGVASGGVARGELAGNALESRSVLWSVVAVTLAGIAGSLVDSMAGATIQAGYACPACDKPTERRVHGCGTRTVLVRGQSWVTNDLVNAICTATGAALAGGALLARGAVAPATSDPEA